MTRKLAVLGEKLSFDLEVFDVESDGKPVKRKVHVDAYPTDYLRVSVNGNGEQEQVAYFSAAFNCGGYVYREIFVAGKLPCGYHVNGESEIPIEPISSTEIRKLIVEKLKSNSAHENPPHIEFFECPRKLISLMP